MCITSSGKVNELKPPRIIQILIFKTLRRTDYYAEIKNGLPDTMESITCSNINAWNKNIKKLGGLAIF